MVCRTGGKEGLASSKGTSRHRPKFVGSIQSSERTSNRRAHAGRNSSNDRGGAPARLRPYYRFNRHSENSRREFSRAVRQNRTCLPGWMGGSGGRRRSEGPSRHCVWYDDFTSLLLDIAKKAGIKASVGRDRVTGERTGWLFQAAQALEPFLYDWMRSKSPEACGKRLERSMRRLRDLKRHKSPSGWTTFVVVTGCGASPTLANDGSKFWAIARKGNTGNDFTVRPRRRHAAESRGIA